MSVLNLSRHTCKFVVVSEAAKDTCVLWRTSHSQFERTVSLVPTNLQPYIHVSKSLGFLDATQHSHYRRKDFLNQIMILTSPGFGPEVE